MVTKSGREVLAIVWFTMLVINICSFVYRWCKKTYFDPVSGK